MATRNQRPNQDIPKVPGPHDWRTTDEDEINKRRLRAREETFRIRNLDPKQPVYSNYAIGSESGMEYQVEIRDLQSRQFACTCVDFRINGLGTCKHVEAVLNLLRARHKRVFKEAYERGSDRWYVLPDPVRDTLSLVGGNGRLPANLCRWFDARDRVCLGNPEEILDALAKNSAGGRLNVHLSQEIEPWLESRRRVRERKVLRREYEAKVQSGEWPAQETLVPLFPYQRDGMLHLAFTERALLADEMGLGKTIQAIAACALLHRLERAQRVLVVTPASLKTEWEDQIQRFTPLPYQVVFGGRNARLGAYDGAPFFTIVNYEQMLRDVMDVNDRLRPDVVVLDEAQRIKNWSARTSQAIKRLRSRYAFVLSGTPIENRIDELHSLMDFLDPAVLGPLFRFNREFYVLDERGRPSAYHNLEELHRRVAPFMLRRRKADVEDELPDRTDRTHFVPLHPAQKSAYDNYEAVVARMAAIARKRPLTQAEQERLLRNLAMMRMTCDTNFILDPEDKTCPKLAELEKIFEECRENPETKLIVFSEWERMLMLVRELCDRLDIGYAWHTGSVPQKRRRAEINLFKNDPECRVFLSTDSGSTGLNLQSASVVINCDLPWNPAKLEQRIARAWRKNQTRPVTVIHLVSEKSIEQSMLETLANKQALSEAVLDMEGDLKNIPLRSGGQAFLKRLNAVLVPRTDQPKDERPAPQALPVDRPAAFARRATELIKNGLVRVDEHYPIEGAHSVLMVVVDRDAQVWQERLQKTHQEFFGPGQDDQTAPVQLEIIDRATADALSRLRAGGLIAKTTRAVRPLFPDTKENSGANGLTPEQRRKREQYHAEAKRRIAMAELLNQGGFSEECLEAVRASAVLFGRAYAVANDWAEPGRWEETLTPPWNGCWQQHLDAALQFQSDPGRHWAGVSEAVRGLIGAAG